MNPGTAIGNWLQRGQNFLLVGGNKWSIDDTSAMLGMYYALTKAGKKVTAICPASVADNIEFLPNTSVIGKTLANQNEFVLSISTEKNKVSDMRHRVGEGRVDIIITGENGPFSTSDVTFKKTSQTFDSIITLGVDTIDDCGDIYENNPQLFADFPVINLSTSLTNDHFGRYNLVDPSKSSVSEIVYDIVTKNETLNKTVDATFSTTILTGILSATDSFLSPQTTANALRIAGKLQESGAEQSTIIEHLFKEKTFNNLKVLGQLLTNLEVVDSHRLAWSSMTASQFESIGTSAEDVDHWLDQILRHTNGADFFMMLVEQDDHAIVQIRSSLPQVDWYQLDEQLPFSGEVFSQGIDILVEGKNISEIEEMLRMALKTYQENRLSLEPRTPLRFAKIVIDHQTENQKLEKVGHAGRKSPPKSPENIPFEAPIRKEEK